MAVPKKKSSRSRSNMRRFASGNKIEKVTLIKDTNGELTRPHRVSLANVDAYVAAKKAKKASKSARA
ncbi:MAG: 50S ribosomal protein L32 [Xanthomonadaceae bacterium]|nr:50S ribosomal protein L32 [Xanthomonadaceae bacterium]